MTTLFTPEALAAAAAADEACVVDMIQRFATYPGAVTPRDLHADPVLMKRLRESSAGNRPAGGPVLVVQGTTDNVVSKAFTDTLVPKMCEEGDTVDYRTYEGAGTPTC